MLSQTSQILNHLKNGNSLTSIEALNLFGCFRLSARIKNLREAGVTIKTETLVLDSGKRVAIYSLGGDK